MLGEVIKFIMRISDIINWFIKPRLKIKPKEEELPPPPQTPQTPKWTKEQQQYWRGYVATHLEKNPAYKSSNGF